MEEGRLCETARLTIEDYRNFQSYLKGNGFQQTGRNKFQLDNSARLTMEPGRTASGPCAEYCITLTYRKNLTANQKINDLIKRIQLFKKGKWIN